MSSQWHPVKKADAVPDDRVVEVMQRGGRTRLGIRVSMRIRLTHTVRHDPDVIRISAVIDYRTYEEIIDVIAWRDVPGTGSLPPCVIQELEEKVAA